jgi:hypothetical protein
MVWSFWSVERCNRMLSLESSAGEAFGLGSMLLRLLSCDLREVAALPKLSSIRMLQTLSSRS